MRQEELVIRKAEPENDDWETFLMRPLPERPGYERENGLAFTRLAVRVLGTPYDETEYYNKLFELSSHENIHVLSETLDKTIAPETFQALQHIHSVNQKRKGFRFPDLSRFSMGAGCLPNMLIRLCTAG